MEEKLFGKGIDLQLFADDQEPEKKDTEEKELPKEPEKSKKLEFTVEEYQEKLRSEVDKAVTKAIKTREEKIRKEEEIKKEEERLKAEKKYEELYKMKEAELNKEKEEIESQKRRLRIETKLNEKGLNSKLADYLDLNKVDESDVIEQFAKELEGLVNARIEKLNKDAQTSVAGTSKKRADNKQNDAKEALQKIMPGFGNKKLKENPYLKI